MQREGSMTDRKRVAAGVALALFAVAVGLPRPSRASLFAALAPALDESARC
jgi:hypothetical protein